MHLAQVNIGRILGAMDSPVMAEFVANLDPINALDNGNATDMVFSEDWLKIVNLSVWESIDTLHTYVYKSHHLDFFRKRAQWFEKATQASYALWWIPKGHTPRVAEAKDRIEHYRKHGATAHSFWFSKPFPDPELTHA